MKILLASERSERDTLRSVQSRIAIYIYIYIYSTYVNFDLEHGHLVTLIMRKEGEIATRTLQVWVLTYS